MYVYGLMDVYLVLLVNIQCYHYFFVQILQVLANGSSFHWLLCTSHLPLCFFKYLPIFWHHKMFQAYLAFSLPQSWKQPGLQVAQLSFIGELYLETKIWTIICSFSRSSISHRSFQWSEQERCANITTSTHVCPQINIYVYGYIGILYIHHTHVCMCAHTYIHTDIQ